ncbi:putative polyketide synthase [Glonium stellatum]|uniref:Putative polyketide synthase n=1 Tax=Glonium stellatum TaxID=574774 RepID=A0A8E2F472_9PEZI|nr:putative polyketide synthase [Glonium stellatum]
MGRNSHSSGRDHDCPAMPIAIIGMSCRLPGDATSPEKLWDLCSKARSGWSSIPPDRFNSDAFYHPKGEKTGTTHVRGGHFLQEDISVFDAPFFNISLEEAKAGVAVEQVAGTDTSVWTGTFTRDYHDSMMRDTQTLPRYFTTGNGSAMLSNRVSYWLDLKGPSVTIDTACSTSLVALHQGCQSLITGESKMSIIGGLNLILNPDMMIGMSNLGFNSPDGRSYSFDHRASGYGRGEGAAVVIIKPLQDALRDKDSIRAVIRATAVNQDGKTNGITNPSATAHEDLIRSCYQKASLKPTMTGFVEAHGTGTQAGDPQEAKAIATVISKSSKLEFPVYVGSIKTNIGHTEAVSGLAGIIKAVMAMEKRQIPPNLNFEIANPKIPLQEWNLKIPTSLEEWPHGVPLRVSVSSLGYGGTNAHAIIEHINQWLSDQSSKQNGNLNNALLPINGDTTGPSQEDYEKQSHLSRYVFLLSSKDKATTSRMVENMCSYVKARPMTADNQFMARLAYTLGQRRSLHQWAVPVSAASSEELIEMFHNIKSSPVCSNDAPKIGLVFTGQGAQWHAMGRELIREYPVFRETILKADKHLISLGAPWSLIDELHCEKDISRVGLAELSQPLCTVIQIALVRLLVSWGVKPSAVVGHSSGEIAAAYAAGALDLYSALAVAYYRGEVALKKKQNNLAPPGGMAAVALSREETEHYIKTLTTGKIIVACVNSPRSVTVSGDLSGIDEITAKLSAKGIFARRLNVDAAYHSHHMRLVSKEYRAHLKGLQPSEFTGATFTSSVSGERIKSGSQLDSDYWVENMAQPVLFSDALSNMCNQPDQLLDTTSVDTLIEVGPHSALAGPIRQILNLPELKDKRITYASCLKRYENAVKTMQELACLLIQKGSRINLQAVNDPEVKQDKMLLDLPTYPWNHSVGHWNESRISKEHRLRRHPPHDLLGVRIIGPSPFAPSWRHIIRPVDLPWVRDHIVQGNIVYPAAGFISMAIEAARQEAELKEQNVTGFSLRDVEILEALIVPDTSDGIETQISLQKLSDKTPGGSQWAEFHIHSTLNDSSWKEHCRGAIRTESMQNSLKTQHRLDPKFQPKQATSLVTVSSKTIYKDLHSKGICHGFMFQNLKEIFISGGLSHATLRIADTKSKMPHQFEHKHIIHPTTLDSALQSMYPTLLQGGKQTNDAKIPRSFESIYIASSITTTPGEILNSYSVLEHSDTQKIKSSVAVMDSDGMPVVEISGFVCVSIGGASISDGIREHKLCFQEEWKEDLAFLDRSFQAKPIGPIQVNDEQLIVQELQQMSFYIIQDTLKCINPSDRSAMAPHHKALYQWMLLQEKLGNEGKLGYQNEQWLSIDVFEKEQLMQRVKKSSINGRTICHVSQSLTEILRGKIEPLQILLEDQLLYRYYETALGLDRSYAQLAEVVERFAHKYPTAKIIEIGAGTGGCTTPVLKQLARSEDKKPRFSSYHFTDISAGFFEAAKQKFAQYGNMIKYKKFNVEDDPAIQGIDCGDFDLVVACRVLHATKNMANTMANVRKLLKPGGHLLLVEGTRDTLDVGLVFGILPGWWVGEEENRKFSPQLSVAEWDELHRKTGFESPQLCLQDQPSEENHWFTVTLAEATALASEQPANHDIAIIYQDNSTSSKLIDWAHDLKLSLEQGLKGHIKIGALSDISAQSKCLIFLGELESPFLDHITSAGFATLKQNLLTSRGVLWVTRGSTLDCTQPRSAMISGIFRTLRSENSVAKYVVVDLDTNTEIYSPRNITAITKIFEKTFNGDTSDAVPVELEYCLRNGEIMIPRVSEDSLTNKKISSITQPRAPEVQPFFQEGRPLRMEIGFKGLLDTLHFVDDPDFEKPLPYGHIEIAPKAFGVNFRDIMVSMGQMNEDKMGWECSGVVTRVGEGIDGEQYRIGDRVCTMTPGYYANFVRIPAVTAIHTPEDMSFETAASLPIVFCTAYYSLYDVARLGEGETILIHAATGGVGQAAIMLAQLVKAKIYATAGTAEKREFLQKVYGIPADHIFSSRDTSFAQKIMAATANKGVSVILNSLAGEMLQASWKCISILGRFVEIGKRDIELNNYLEMSPFCRNVSFTSVDLTVLLNARNGHLLARILNDVMVLFKGSKIQAVQPIDVFRISEIQQAFRLMQAGKHRGKLVIKPQPDDLVKVLPRKRTLKLRSDASYIICGGLGGIGRSIARWMARVGGAKHLILLSRKASSHPAAQPLIAELKENNCTAVAVDCDVINEEDVGRVVASYSKNMPQVAGIIQAAMVLQDTVLENMTHDQYMQAVEPKVKGTWNLHTMFSQQPLDFFVMLSSIVGVVGNISQSNYGAGNAFQDALARHRIRQGLPAVSIDLGLIESVGYVAENEALSVRLQKYLDPIREDELLALVQSAIEEPYSCQIITGLSINQTQGDSLGVSDPRFLSLLQGEPAEGTEQGAAPGQNKITLRAQLSELKSKPDVAVRMLDAITKKLSLDFMIPEAGIEPSKPISSFGVDSLVAVELRNWLIAQTRIETIAVFDILQSPSLMEFSNTLADRYINGLIA